MGNPYFSQFRQDEFLNEVIFNRKRNGFFIDIGAHDGITISNTLYFEKAMEWKGLCIEPNPNVFAKLIANRHSTNLNVCVGNGNKTVRFTMIEGYSEMLSGISDAYNEKHLDRINREIESKGGEKKEIDVEMITLDSIPEIQGQQIDFISIDTEGNEFDIVKSINFDVLDITALVIENNYGDGRIKDYLQGFGYDLVYSLDCDEVFVQKKSYSIAMKSRIFDWQCKQILNRILRKIGLKR
jgi:FkbM family methyltransferase